MPQNATPPRLIFITLVLITFISPLAVHMFVPAMPLIKHDFNISDQLAFATLSLTTITMAFTTILFGGLSDQWGRKKLLIAGLSLYTIGAVTCWLAANIESLLVGRILQGGGAGCSIVLARAIARDIYGMDRIASVIANLTAAYVLGPLLSPMIGGFIIAWQGWRTLFVTVSLIGLAILLLVSRFLPETNLPAQPIARFFVILKNMGKSYGQLLKTPQFSAYAFIPGGGSGVFFAHVISSPFLAIETLKISPASFGTYFIMMPLGYMTGNLLSGRVGNRASIGFMTIGGSTLCLLIVFGEWLWYYFGGLSIMGLMVPGALLGIAQGMCLPYAQAGAMKINPSLAGSAAAAVVFTQLLFAGIAEQTVGFLADGTIHPTLIVMFGFSILSLSSAIFAERQNH